MPTLSNQRVGTHIWLLFLLGYSSLPLIMLAQNGAPDIRHTINKEREQRISVKEQIVFNGWKQYSLAVAATLAEAPNGDILCCWMSGSGGEPEGDNCVLLARSKDGGNRWSEPIEWIPAGEMASAIGALYTTGDKKKIVFIGYYMPAEKHYTEEYFFRMESHDSGHTWTEPERQVLRPNNDAVTTHSPLELTNGEYLFPAQFFEKRPKPLLGPVHRLVHANSEEEALEIPAGKGEDPYKFGTHLHGCSVFISKYENGREMREFGHIDNRPLGLLEPTAVELKDGRVVMLMRAEWGGFLWRAESSDSGRTWTDAWETNIPNPTVKPYLLRLDDGRIALIHNATGRKGEFGDRDPLSIWISADEMETWSIKEDVIRGGSLAYPNAIMLNGKLVFAYDRNRREARFVKVEFE